MFALLYLQMTRSHSGLLIGKSVRGSAVGDYDIDGNPDILVVNLGDRPNLYRNEGGNGNHWIGFHQIGTRSNRDAIGWRIEIEARGRKQMSDIRSGGSYLWHGDMSVHSGLGSATRSIVSEYAVPTATQELAGFDADHYVTIREGK
jgi:hypothetical protein